MVLHTAHLIQENSNYLCVWIYIHSCKDYIGTYYDHCFCFFVVVAEASALTTRSVMCTSASNKESHSTSKEASPTF